MAPFLEDFGLEHFRKFGREHFRNRLGSLILFIGCWISCWWGQYLVILPFYLLLPIKLSLFRSWADLQILVWHTWPTWCLEYLIGCEFFYHGDPPPENDPCVVMLNHRTMFDYMFYWVLLARSKFSRAYINQKIVLKAELAKIPGFGWAMDMNLYLFLTRKWETDKKNLCQSLNYFVDNKLPQSILLFPEGTDYCAKSKKSSDAFAQKNNLPIYNYVLHPRTTGFVATVQHLRKKKNIDAVYDITVGYPDGLPQGVGDFFKGVLPKECHFNVKRYDINDLPEDDVGLGQWCCDRYAEKEEMLKEFYQKKRFSTPAWDPKFQKAQDHKARMKSCLGMIVWVIYLATFLYLFFTNSWVFWWTILGSIFLTVLSHTCTIGGFERLMYYKWFKTAKQTDLEGLPAPATANLSASPAARETTPPRQRAPKGE